LRQLKGKPQAAQTFCGNSDFLRIFGMGGVPVTIWQNWRGQCIGQPRRTQQNPLTSRAACRNPTSA
jgi:hypothetical protein